MLSCCGVRTTEHIDVLCDVNRKERPFKLCIYIHEKRSNLWHILLIFKPHV